MVDMTDVGLPTTRAGRRRAESGRRPVRPIRRPNWLNLGLGAFVTVLAMLAGFVAGAVQAQLPVMPLGNPAVGSTIPPNPAGITIGVVNGQFDSTEATVEQIVGLLERAEATALSSDILVKSAISTAASDLGTLLTTYLYQQPVELDQLLPVAGEAPEVPYPLVPPLLAEVEPTESEPAPADEPAPAYEPEAPVFEPLPAEPGTPQNGLTQQWLRPAAASAGAPEVTIDEIISAAIHLSELMDRVGVSVVGAEDEDEPEAEELTLEELLAWAVEMWGNSLDGFYNGELPDDVLCPLPFAPTHRLRCDAAMMLIALNEAFEAEFGRALPITDSYRTFQSQVALRARVGNLAASPGLSMHGWGLAVDFGRPINSGNSAEYIWLRVNAPDFGWDNPVWARPDGSKPEPWHFEFFAAGPIPNRARVPDDVVTTGDVNPPPSEYGDASPDAPPAGQTSENPPADG